MSFDAYEYEQNRSVDELVENWINGNRKEVIANLSQRHPAVTAHFMLEAIQTSGFGRGDANSVVNMLIDNQIEIRDSRGLAATHRPL